MTVLWYDGARLTAHGSGKRAFCPDSPYRGQALPAEAFFGRRNEVKVAAKAGGMF